MQVEVRQVLHQLSDLILSTCISFQREQNSDKAGVSMALCDRITMLKRMRSEFEDEMAKEIV